MIKFNEIKYERINYDKTIMLVNNLLEQLVNCNDFSEYLELVKRINSIQNHINWLQFLLWLLRPIPLHTQG